MKDEKTIDYKERFITSIRQGKQAQGGVMESLVRGVFFLQCVFLEEEENECVRGKLVVMCEEMLFMEVNGCKQKSMEGSCM